MSDKASMLLTARRSLHAALLKSGVLCLTSRENADACKSKTFPSNADGDSVTSIAIAQAIFDQIQSRAKASGKHAAEVSCCRFEQITRSFIEEAFSTLRTLHPEKFNLATNAIMFSKQYQNLINLPQFIKKSSELAILLGSDYVITPDVLVVKSPDPDEVPNARQILVNDRTAQRSALRRQNGKPPLLQCAISCKWTLRRGDTETARSEALNLIRKSRVRHIAVVTAEPLPSSLAILALGTGDIDRVYHFALPELMKAVKSLKIDDSLHLMKIMVSGNRLKDIADLPLDLACSHC
ncbi:MAG TPA: NgoMIV family type II restriction endonuclease [Candidatus Saccharimonadales bacterium]|jgi:hypothetical protein|nr:NgoMIV family type II restriction endonuclease [Candidatus Saccharimonadales bacterium]